MIELTEAARRHIEESAQQGGCEGLGLRIAVHPGEDGGYAYAIGFDEQKDGDLRVDHGSIHLLLDQEQRDYLEESTLDYVEIEHGQMSLIVINPNDPAQTPPKTSDAKGRSH